MELRSGWIDTVNHFELIEKFKIYNFYANLIKLLTSYLQDRTQIYFIDVCSSCCFKKSRKRYVIFFSLFQIKQKQQKNLRHCSLQSCVFDISKASQY